jgi:hypothetical protein
MIDAAREADDSVSMPSSDWNITDYIPSESDPAYDGRNLLSRALTDWKHDLVGETTVAFLFLGDASEKYLASILYFTDDICIKSTETGIFENNRIG